MSDFLNQIEEYISTRESDLNILRQKLDSIDELLEFDGNIKIVEGIIKNNGKTPISVEELADNRYISAFWRKIDLQIIYTQNQKKIQEYNFREYYFPQTIESSFLALRDKDNKIVFDIGVAFHKAHFMGQVKFDEFIFMKKVSFNDTHFYEKTELTHCRFEGETYLRKAIFDKEVDFNSSRFEDVTLDEITFPVDDKIRMKRVTLEKIIWTNFINEDDDVSKIDSERETFARLKHANSERGNFIDSNLFFIEESNRRFKESKYKFLCKNDKSFWCYLPIILLSALILFVISLFVFLIKPFQWDFSIFYISIPITIVVVFLIYYNNEDIEDMQCPNCSLKKLKFVGDIISFLIAKYTTNFGQSWIVPLLMFVGLFLYMPTVFQPNIDFVSTETTPFFLLDENLSKKEPIDSNISVAFYNKNYYSEYVFDFQKESKFYLKDDYTTKLMFVYSSLAPTLMSSSHWFSTMKEETFRKKAMLTIFFWYFLGAFIYALKNRTRRV